MSDELIRKSGVLNLLDDLGLNLIDYNIKQRYEDYVHDNPELLKV